jgi:hypothetical protein
MNHKEVKYCTFALFLTLSLMAFLATGHAQKPEGDHSRKIPKTFDEEALATMDVPLASAAFSPVHGKPEIYYSTRVRPLYKTYPVYAPGKEPPGYMEWLKQQEPELIPFDVSKFKTEEDWIKAGEIIFDAAVTLNRHSSVSEVRGPALYEKTGLPVAKDGTVPFYRYVVTKKGEVSLGEFSCGMCHTRVMPDGSIIKGAQGNFPFDKIMAFGYRTTNNTGLARGVALILSDTPWLDPNPHARLKSMSLDEIASAHEAIPPGAITRFGSSIFSPPQVPDLIGVKDRRYFDHTGLVQHRTIGDLMRYSAIVQGADIFDHFGGKYWPLGKEPSPAILERYSDEQLYALALYVYSLKPPPNPNKFDALAARGKKVFEREGCGGCHPPPLYTNNKLTPVDGFKVPEDHLKKFDVLPISVGTDPNLALNTRRGTGYYKVPSLKGVWYRGPFEHNGAVATLEDWFDPRRIRSDYVPTGFRGAGVNARAVKGHLFGLDLSAGDRKALIAFLKTL